IAKYLPPKMVEWFLDKKKPFVLSRVKGVKSKTGAQTEGVFIGLPMVTSMFINGRPERAYERILECCEIAKQEGCEVIGLGAFTSVVGDGGVTVARKSPIAVTTGNSYTVATAIIGTLRACEMLELDPAHSKLAIVGATGSIGKTCAAILAPKFGSTLLVGRDKERTEEAAKGLPSAIATTNFEALSQADVIITVTSSESAIVQPKHLKQGALVCDVARPRDVSVRVQKERPDVLVIEGGVVKVPGNVEFGFDFGFPPETAYACMSETMMLALEDDPVSYTVGKNVSVEQVEQTLAWAEKHGFEISGFRSFEREVDQEMIQRAKEARKNRMAS
ncbi:MAG: shikimate dehydrogenase, partial [Armatimonadota bacterium]